MSISLLIAGVDAGRDDLGFDRRTGRVGLVGAVDRPADPVKRPFTVENIM